MGRSRYEDESWGEEEEDWGEDCPDDDEEEDEDDDGLTHCPYCRKLIFDEAERCPYCGHYISEEDAPRGPRPWWFVLGFLLASLIVLSWILFFH